MTTTRAAIEQALAAGPIPGPWYVKDIKGYCTDEIHTSHPDWQREGTHRSFVTSADHAHGHDTQIFSQCARYIASVNPAAITQLLADHDAEKKALEDELVRVRERFGKVLVAIDDAWANYERMGEVCPFEGQPMIYAATLEEIHNVAIDAALSPTTTNKKEL